MDSPKAPPVPKMVGVARTMAPFFAEMGISNMGATMEGGEFDPTNTTLYVGGIGAATTEQDLRDAKEPYGRVAGVKLVPRSRCAFVEFGDRDGAEAAFTGCGGTIAVGSVGLVCSVNWAKTKARSHANSNVPHSGIPAVPPPPGVTIPASKSLPSNAPAGAMYYPSASGAMEGSAPKIKK